MFVWNQAITWTNADLVSMGPIEANISACFFIKFINFSLKTYIWRCVQQNVTHVVQTSLCKKNITYISVEYQAYYMEARHNMKVPYEK